MFATRRSILLLTAAVLIGGCASTPYQQWRARMDELGCNGHSIYEYPTHARYFGVEPMRTECMEFPPATALSGMERMSVHDAETGSTRSVFVPRDTVIVK